MSSTPQDATDPSAHERYPDPNRVKFLYVYDRHDSPVGTKEAEDRRVLPTTAEGAIRELFTNNGKYARFIHACQQPAVDPGRGSEEATRVRVRLTPREVGLDINPKSG